jgi:sialic acid synthase SpsE
LIASRRSLCAWRALDAGHVVSADDLVALRPGTGLPPASLPQVVGRRLTHALAVGDALTERHLEPLRFSESDRVA